MTTSETTVAPLTLSFMSANYVGTELGYGAANDWGPFDRATNEAFAPIETFAERFESLLTTIATAGYDALDLWMAHLNWTWATPEHVRIARAALDEQRPAAREPRRELRQHDCRAGVRLSTRERPRRRSPRRHGHRPPRRSSGRRERAPSARSPIRVRKPSGDEPRPGARADRRCRRRARGDGGHRLVGDPRLRPRARRRGAARATVPRALEGRRTTG